MDIPADRPASPDPALFWVWISRATRPRLGWLLTGLGALAIIIGYLGLSRRVLVAEQLPYLISGGIGGMAMIVIGGVLVATEDVRRDQDRIAALEDDVASLRQMVEELHLALLRPADPARSAARVAEHTTRFDAPVAGGADDDQFAVPGGTTFHQAGCAMLDGKAKVSAVSPATVRRRGLEPCPLCAPVPARS